MRKTRAISLLLSLALFGNQAAVVSAASADDAAVNIQSEYTTAVSNMAAAAAESTFESEGITYSVISDEEVQVGSGSGPLTEVSGSVEIPSVVTYEGVTYRVTAVADKAFMDNAKITEVVLPEGVKKIGSMAFGRSSVTQINLPEGLTEIGESAFLYTEQLKSAVFPASLTKLERNAFSSSAVSEVTIKEGLENIGYGAFSGCESLTSITIPASVRTISEEAFASTSLTSCVIAEGSVLEIVGDRAFNWDSSLKSINLPESVKKIGSQAFNYCEKLTTTGLEKTESALEEIGSQAFNKTSIREITIPASCTGLDVTALYGLKTLTAVHASEGNPGYTDVQGVLFDKEQKTLLVYPAGYAGTKKTYTVPYGVEVIASYAFQDASKVNNLIIPEGVKTIEAFAFQNAAIQSVEMTDTVSEIGKLAFQRCTDLYEIGLSKTLKSIPEYLFYGCTSLEELEIPASVEEIGGNFVQGCSALTSLTLKMEKIDTEKISRSAFIGLPEGTAVTVETDALMNYLTETCGVPAGQITSNHNDPIPEVTEFTAEDGVYYKVLTAPSDQANGTVQLGNGSEKAAFAGSVVEIPETVTDPATGQKFDVVKIAENAFYCNYDASEVVIPKTVKEIEGNAFYYAYFLEKISFAEGSMLQKIGASAFNSCGNLKKLDLPASITELDPQAFANSSLEELSVAEGCTAYKTEENVLFDAGMKNLIFYSAAKTDKTYTIPDTVEVIGEGAFSGNKKLVNIIGGSGLREIGKKAFANLAELKSVTLQSAETIGNMGFSGCGKLNEVILPDNLKTIEDYAFYRCNDLTELILPASVRSIGNDALISTMTDISIEAVRGEGGLEITEAAFKSVKESYYKVASESLKEALVAIGVPEENITVSEELLKNGAKEAEFTEDGIRYAVTEDPSEEKNGSAAVQGITSDAAADLVIPETVRHNGYLYEITAISDGAFYKDDVTVSVKVPASVETIGVNGLAAMSRLTEVTFEEGSRLRVLGNGAISDNHALTGITIPAGVEEFGDYVLAWNYGLQEVRFADGFRWTAVPKGFVFRDKDLTGFRLPEGTDTIEDEAFYNCSALKAIDLSGIKTIGEAVFNGCTSLESVRLSNDLTELESGTFTGCTALKEVVLGSNLTRIGSMEKEPDAEDEPEGVFKDCAALESITIPAGVTQIPKETFCGCTKLAKVEILGDNLEKIGANAFLDIADDARFITYGEKTAETLKNAGVSAEQIDEKKEEKPEGGSKPDSKDQKESGGSTTGKKDGKETSSSASSALKNGQKFKSGKNSYAVLSASKRTAVFVKAKNAKKVTVPATVRFKGVILKVVQIGKKAFTGKKIRTVTIGRNVKKIAPKAFGSSRAARLILKCGGLKKSSVRGALKGSRVKMIQVKAGTGKQNKKLVKKYRKIFTKKNAGRKVSVK